MGAEISARYRFLGGPQRLRGPICPERLWSRPVKTPVGRASVEWREPADLLSPHPSGMDEEIRAKADVQIPPAL